MATTIISVMAKDGNDNHRRLLLKCDAFYVLSEQSGIYNDEIDAKIDQAMYCFLFGNDQE